MGKKKTARAAVVKSEATTTTTTTRRRRIEAQVWPGCTNRRVQESSLHRLDPSLHPHGQAQGHADHPRQAAQPSQLPVRAELDVAKHVGEPGGEIADAQGVEDARVKPGLVGGEDTAREEAQGFEAVLGGALCAEDHLLALEEERNC